MSFAGSASIELDARRLREAFSSGLADALPLLVGYLDRDARYLFVNRAYEAWFKRDRDQIEGRPMAQVLGDAAFARIRPFIDRVLTGERVIYKGEMAQDLAGFRHIEARFTPDVAADGAVRGFYLTVQEIPARQASDPELGHLLHRERRRVALLDLGRQLREEIDPQAVALLACGVLAQQLAAPRVGYAQVDAQHRNAARSGLDNRADDRRACCHRAGPQVIAIRKSAGYADEVKPIRQRLFAVPQPDWSMAGDAFDGHRKVAVAVGPGEGDDRRFHQASSTR